MEQKTVQEQEHEQEQEQEYWKGPKAVNNFGPRDLAAYSAGTGPKKDSPGVDDLARDVQHM